MDKSQTPRHDCRSCRYITLCRGVLDLSIIQSPFSITKSQIRNLFIAAGGRWTAADPGDGCLWRRRLWVRKRKQRRESKAHQQQHEPSRGVQARESGDNRHALPCHGRAFGWESSSRGRFETPADSARHDWSPYRGLYVRRGSLRFVPRSRGSFCRPVPNLGFTIRNFFTAVRRDPKELT
jgi:hypothetical protein